MGTRFMACDESAYPPAAKRAVVEGTDGGCTTMRTSVFDVLRGLPWPNGYDGRVIKNTVTREIEEGKGVEEVKGLWERSTKEGNAAGLVSCHFDGITGRRSVLSLFLLALLSLLYCYFFRTLPEKTTGYLCWLQSGSR